MGTTLSINSKFSLNETKLIMDEAMENQMAFAHSRFKKFDSECNNFERKYKMDSEQFLDKFESGELGDDLQWFDWYAASKGRDLWGNKNQKHKAQVKMVPLQATPSLQNGSYRPGKLLLDQRLNCKWTSRKPWHFWQSSGVTLYL